MLAGYGGTRDFKQAKYTLRNNHTECDLDLNTHQEEHLKQIVTNFDNLNEIRDELDTWIEAVWEQIPEVNWHVT